MMEFRGFKLLTGSINDLERLTGKLYEAMIDGKGEVNVCVACNVVSKEVPPSKYLETLADTAREIGADALVHVVFYSNSEGSFAFGYPVKENKDSI